MVYKLIAVMLIGRVLGYLELNLMHIPEIKLKHTLNEKLMDLSSRTPLIYLEDMIYYDRLHKAKQIVDGDVLHSLLYDFVGVLQSIISLGIYVGILSVLGWPIIFFALTVIPKVWVQVRMNQMKYGYYLQSTLAERRAWCLLELLAL